MHISEARQSNFPVSINVLVCAPVYTLHQVFLKQERVVSSHGTGTVVKLLVVVANVSLPLGREEFIHVHFVTQRHHDQNAKRSRRWGVRLNMLQRILLNNIPELPLHFWIQDIEGLLWMSNTIQLVGFKKLVVWFSVPLMNFCMIWCWIPDN